MSVTGRNLRARAGWVPVPPPVAGTAPPESRAMTARLLAWVWLTGLVSAAGIGAVRAAFGNLDPDGGGPAGIVFLIALGFGSCCQPAAAVLLRRSVRRVRPADARPLRTAVVVLALAGAAMIALNTVLCSGPGLLRPFGPLSLLLLCLPYPLVFVVIATRSRRVGLVVAVVVVAMAGSVTPLRAAQEHLAADAWLDHHSGIDPLLLQAVDWPGGRQGTFVAGSDGVRADVYFADTGTDGFAEGVVTVSGSGTDPCGGIGVVANYQSVPDDDLMADGRIITLPVAACAPAGPHRWTLSGRGFTGYAERRDGVLVRLSVTSWRTKDDLSAVAGTLHALDDHQLWSRLNTPFGLSWLVS
ncbi:hypothetical protein ABT275_21775 [Streptomyces sp. NPDC001185]|uniref:hypothetical protein n=1 Tax=Streptomyces sp. NPDC001185 TaxID=3154380 RepID=UPI00331D8BC0